jgi:uncharacterized RDD family membrane protein YckC
MLPRRIPYLSPLPQAVLLILYLKMTLDNYPETPAGRGKRLINSIVDTGAYLLLWMLLSFVVIFVGVLFDYNPTYTDESGEAMPLLPMLLLLPVFWAYYVVCEYLFQRTLGKLLTRTKVVSESDAKPTFKQIVIRTLCRSIPFDSMSFLTTSIGVHDRLSDTKVVEL